MAPAPGPTENYSALLGRLLIFIVFISLLGTFLLWRIDTPRVERFRSAVIDRVVPGFSWISKPITAMGGFLESFQSYQKVLEQNKELRRELLQIKEWREAARQLEQENARLLDLNKVRLDPKFTHVTGVVLADSGSPFRQSVILNVGKRDGVINGWATMDGIGLVGRISGVGDTTSRVILLSDSASRIPITIQPSGQRALLAGDNTHRPIIEFLEQPEQVRPGDRVVTSGDGGVFPANLLVGQIALDRDGNLRVRMAADIEQLEFLRVIRTRVRETITDPGGLVGTPDRESINPIVPRSEE